MNAVLKFSLPLNGKGNNTFMTIWHDDSARIIYSPFDMSSLPRSLELLKEKLSSEEWIDQQKTVKDLVLYFENECKVRLEEEDQNFSLFNVNGKRKAKSKSNKSADQQQPPKRQFTSYKYSNKGKGPLFEAIILAARPVFLKYVNGKIESWDAIEDDTRIIKPPHLEHYPYDPVEFENMNEVARYHDVALNYNIDMLYLQAKKIASDYNDQKKDKINLLLSRQISNHTL